MQLHATLHILSGPTLSVIRWIPDTNDHSGVSFDLVRSIQLLHKSPVHESVLLKVPHGRCVESVSQVHVCTVKRQLTTFLEHQLRQPEVRHRIRTNQYLEGMELLSQPGSVHITHSWAKGVLYLGQRVLHDCQWVSTCSS